MFYLASDNPLAPSIVSQLKALKAAGFHADANVIARFDPYTRNTPSHVFEVNLVEKIKGTLKGEPSNVGFTANDPFVRNLVLDKIWDDDDEVGDSVRESITKQLEKRRNGSAAPMPTLPRLPKGKFKDSQPPRQSLHEFLTFCAENYPARRYMLFILGHGVAVGNDIFLFDSDTDDRSDEAQAADAGEEAREGNNNRPVSEAERRKRKEAQRSRNALTLTQLGEVLSTFRETIKKRDESSEFELVGFHSCSMSGMEVAYELKGTANYMLASQGPAFVGSWPYRHMLLRVFNDLNAPLMLGDLEDGRLLAGLKSGNGPLAKHLHNQLKPETKELLDAHDETLPPTLKLKRGVVRDLRSALNGRDLPGHEEFVQVAARGGRAAATTTTRHANRALLESAFGGLAAEKPVMSDRDVRDMLTKLYYYVLYNSYDFQLAGYSFDLCLCDLRKVEKIQKPLDDLARALIAGLKGGVGLAPDAEPLARELILLAHWDAQSFWKENYTDLYDFCFRLRRRREYIFPKLKESSGIRDAIRDACKEMMKVLEKGTGSEDDDRFIVRAEFAGPEYQYSHGLSIYFPWSMPTDGFFSEKYVHYKLVQKKETVTDKRSVTDKEPEAEKETAWGDFLKAYFEKTQRETSQQEEKSSRAYAREDANGSARAEASHTDSDVLRLLERISESMFNSAEQLAKGGDDSRTDDPLPISGKGGDDDRAGDCGCASIKNYPSFTGMSRGAKENFRLTNKG